MAAKKFKPFGICSFCLKDLETIDSDPKFMRHAESKELWRECIEGRSGVNRLRDLVRTNLPIPNIRVAEYGQKDPINDPGEEKKAMPKPGKRDFGIFGGS